MKAYVIILILLTSTLAALFLDIQAPKEKHSHQAPFQQ